MVRHEGWRANDSSYFCDDKKLLDRVESDDPSLEWVEYAAEKPLQQDAAATSHYDAEDFCAPPPSELEYFLSLRDECERKGNKGAADSDVAALVDRLHANFHVRRVSVRWSTGVTDVGAERLRTLLAHSAETCPILLRVDLAGTSVSGLKREAVRRLCEVRAFARLLADDPRVTSIDWDGAHVSDAVATKLAKALQGNTHCLVLRLRNNPTLTDVGASALCEAVRASRLEEVRLSNTGVSVAQQQSILSLSLQNTLQHVQAEEPAMQLRTPQVALDAHRNPEALEALAKYWYKDPTGFATRCLAGDMWRSKEISTTAVCTTAARVNEAACMTPALRRARSSLKHMAKLVERNAKDVADAALEQERVDVAAPPRTRASSLVLSGRAADTTDVAPSEGDLREVMATLDKKIRKLCKQRDRVARALETRFERPRRLLAGEKRVS